MSSSAAKRQVVSDAPAFTYAEADLPAGASGSALNGGPAAEERSRRQQAEIFEQGRQSAQQQFRSELDSILAKSREQIGGALQQFALERRSYYRRIESEVVELALAIARKILHREAQLDPHVLAGIVRVTLDELETGTKVNLYVHLQEAADWRHYFACQTADVPAPDVHEDPALAPGECRIETSMGSTQVGLQSQLKEIETGLLDLLAERPDRSPGSSSARTPNSSAPNPLTSGRTPETR